MARFHLEMTFDMEVEGTEAEVQELRDRIDDLVYDALPWYCGEPECCPVKPDGIYGSAGFGSSEIQPITEEVDT